MVSNHRAQSPKEEEAATQLAARELFEWLSAITPEKILDDTTQTLDQHYERGLAAATPEHSYDHQSEYVHFSAHRSESADKPAKTFLRPARLYGVIKEGYDGVFYPTYQVLKS